MVGIDRTAQHELIDDFLAVVSKVVSQLPTRLLGWHGIAVQQYHVLLARRGSQ